MNTQNFNTVNDLAKMKSDNKASQYLVMARNFALKADEMANKNPELWMLKMSAKEVVLYMRKAEGSDCEYTSYINANHAEKWLEKMNQTMLNN